MSNSTKAAIQLFAVVFMLVMAANLLGGFVWLRRLTPCLPQGVGARLLGRTAGKSSFYVGLVNGIMPCGLLQAMHLYALSAESWRLGALSMFCFCLGTIPLMLIVGLVEGKLNLRFARPMRTVSAVLVLVMGVSVLASGLALAGIGVPAAKPVGIDGVAVIENGMQYVRSELEFGGYPVITVQTGVPVEWTIHADAGHINSCNKELYGNDQSERRAGTSFLSWSNHEDALMRIQGVVQNA